ncbi:MAG: AAA family ATPase [Bacteroidota bacterium]
MIIYALYNLKGGVGKTTSCVNLAYLAAKEGKRTLVWDLDPQGAASFYLRANQEVNGEIGRALEGTEQLIDKVESTAYNNLYLLKSGLQNRVLDIKLGSLEKSKKRLKIALSSLKAHFDFIFIDCPPTISMLAENIFKSVHFVLFPLIPTPLSERSYWQVVRFFEAHGHDARKIVPFFTLVDRRKNIHKATISAFRESKRKLLRTIIPQSAVFERMGLQQAPVHAFSPYSKPSMSYRNLWQELKMMRKLKKLR